MLRTFYSFLTLAVLGLMGFPAMAQETSCNDGIDNDGDGLIDCYDPDCGGTEACADFYYGVPSPSCQFIPDAGAEAFALELIWQTDNTNYPIDQRQTPMVGDIDGDGMPEVMVLQDGIPGYIRIFDGETGDHERSISVAEGTSVFANLAFGDVDDDGTAEIFVVTKARHITRYEHDGTLTWTSTLTVYDDYNSTNIADFDQDGTPEVYVGNLIVDAETGATRIDVSGNTSYSTGGYSDNESYPVAIDVFSSSDVVPATGSPCGGDCDGLELVAGNVVYAVDLTQTTGLTAVSTLATQADGVTSVCDFDQNGNLDAVVMAAGRVYVWDLVTATELYTAYDVPGTSAGGRCNVADFDNDGELEIGVAGKNIYVVLEPVTGALTAKWSDVTDDGSMRTGSTVFDFEGDGQNEVVYSDEENLLVYNGATGAKLSEVISRSGTRYDYPLVVDVNADGMAEIVITSQDGNGPGFSGTDYVRAYRSANTPWVAAREVWNQHNFHNTNINDDLTIPQYQQNHDVVDGINGFLVQSTIRLEGGLPAFAAPDAQLQVLGISDAKCAQDTLLINLRVSNSGDGRLPAGAPVAFYLGNPRLAGASLLDESSIPNTVEPGATEEFTVAAAFTPGDLPADIFVVINDTGFVDAALPLSLQDDFPVTGVGECSYLDNISSVYVDGNCASTTDNDKDGITDVFDLDDDNDGIPDASEDGGTGFDASGDEDGDDIPNYMDNDDTTPGFIAWVDANSDGVHDSFDTDGDGVPDLFDLDSDNDGLTDLVEAGGQDADGNGMVDGFSSATDATSLTDADADGWWDTYDNAGGGVTSGTPLSLPDTDGDGIPGFLDLDSDNDGIPDAIEAGAVDFAGDGVPDQPDDQDRDGLADAFDPDDDGSFGPDAGESAEPLLMTTGDAGNGRPTGYTACDADADGVPNMLDLDSDNDGIADLVEAGGTDADRDGMADVATDTDGDGFADTFDADNSGSPLVSTGADSNGDGRPEDYGNHDFDSDGLLASYDVDADDDGLLDNLEAQSSSAYAAPAATDANGDGILDAYAGGFLSPVDTDSDGSPDFRDTDSDADGMADRHEAWDAYDDGDAVSDLTCTTDADGDGYLDCYDSDDADATVHAMSPVPPQDNGFDGTAYTASKTSTGTLPDDVFPNNGGSVDEPDWRDDGCILNPGLSYPITGTSYLYNSSTGLHELSDESYGSIRATQFCHGWNQAGWTYYFNPMNPEEILFAIEHGTNTTQVDFIELRRGDQAFRKALSGGNGYLVMARDWYVQTVDDAPLTGNINIRFYFDPADSSAMEAAADAILAANGGGRAGLQWFKVANQWDPADIQTATGMSHLDNYMTLTPSGFGAEAGFHYVQFDNLSSLSGGSLLLELDESLPVEWLGLEATDGPAGVRLDWTVAHESNLLRYEIERATDNGSFEVVGMTYPEGEGHSQQSYHFVDGSAMEGRLTYRVKNVDLDGMTSYSPSIQVERIAYPAELYPNPATDGLSLLLDEAPGPDMRLLLLDLSGRVMRGLPVVSRETHADISDLPPGMYFFRLLNGSQVLIEDKWIKQ
ncbi:MAG: T9SS C-terminal target domain-containing protein [Bacteroidetes bacterium]|nr:MAG: T9SS C-terminal target domain-containing protein [Bacteroidota bacterium]